MSTLKEQRDNVLGRTLAGVLASQPPQGMCPSAESVAALVDGRLSGETRDRLLGHLATCRNCREIFTLTAELTRPGEQQSNRRRLVMTGTIAAVLVAAVSLTLVSHAPKQQVALQKPLPVPLLPSEPPPRGSLPDTGSPGTKAPMAGESLVAAARLLADSQGTASITPVAADRVLGFVGMSNQLQVGIDLGRNLFLLELTLARGDRSAAARTLGEIQRQAERLNLATGARAALRQLAGKLAGKAPLSDVQGRAGAVITLSLAGEQRHPLLLGEWVQGALLAAGAGRQEYFQNDYFRHTADSLALTTLPAPLRAKIAQVADLARRPALSGDDFRQIERLAEDMAGE